MTPARSAALILGLATAGVANAQPVNADTLRLEVGSTRVNGKLYAPHAARVRVYVGDALTNEWTNELTLGDSAGRRVMR